MDGKLALQKKIVLLCLIAEFPSYKRNGFPFVGQTRKQLFFKMYHIYCLWSGDTEF
uniref:Uncharacterized protein n=1 Tax=Marseillevirus sp. TaxID=2809551 RepID=A0AA96IXD3_9VIRU|nr:hypothetical protein MarFTMF_012 [Marseillevirus sp.]